MDKVLKGLHQHCEGSMFDRCGECPYRQPDFSPTSGIDCRDELIEGLYELVKEQQQRIEDLSQIIEMKET